MTAAGRESAVAEATLGDVLVELQAIRGLLEQQAANVALCPHGATGICMSCITPQIDYALTQIVQNVGNTVWEATRHGR